MPENDNTDDQGQESKGGEQETKQGSAEQDVESLPAWARESLSKANREAASFRTKLKELEPLAAKARELEESQKTEAEKAAERAQAAEQKASSNEALALKYEVALDKGLTKTQAKRLVGATREELEADADDLLASFGGGQQSKGSAPGERKPRENLRGGSNPDDEPEESDPAKLAASISANR